jgi:branched-chain amino acid transport system substrate-binding protein
MAVKEINAAGGILGKKIEHSISDTQTNPGVAKGLAAKAIDDEAFAVFGPVFSGSIMVSMAETQRAEVPNFTGGEAAAITQKGNPYIFRTSFTQASAMPKVAKYIAGGLKARTVAVMFVNNDFGKGGRDAITKALEANGVKVVADISTDSGQVDFSAPVLKAKNANADALFVYTNEEESARALRELRKQGYNKPIVGETTLTGQKVIDLAGDAANGALAHVGLTVDAENPLMLRFKGKFYQETKTISDHNGIKGYTGVYVLKAAIEKAGKLDRKAVAQAMKGLKVSAAKNPGVLMDVSFDDKGDLDRESFLVEVKGGKQVVKEALPALSKK